MRGQDFKLEIAKFDLDLKRLNLTFKNSYDESNRKDIFRLCRKITRYDVPTSKDGKIPIKEDSLKGFSIRSLKIFENNFIIDFFEDKVEGIKVVRDKTKATGDAYLEYDKQINGSMHYIMHLPKKDLCVTDQLSYSHELGHIPELDLIRNSYLEYSEGLPIFMEYLSELKRHNDPEDALDYFLFERLPIEQSGARDIMNVYKNIENPNDDIRLYHMQLFADYYKYLESLEFALQLVDRMKDDRKAVGDEIEYVIKGQSMIETAENLSIDTDGCERVIEECKRLSR